MELKRILLIEDNPEVRQNVIQEFSSEGIEIIEITDYGDLEDRLITLLPFQMVILDWLLDGETDNDAMLCLNELRKTCFVPVVIWTEELEIFEEANAKVKQMFPEACFQRHSKSNVNPQQLRQMLSEWYQQPPARLAEQFRQSVAAAVEQALYTLAEQSIDDLTKGMKTLISLGESSEVDMEHATNVMLRVLGRQLYRDTAFTNQLKQIVTSLATSNSQASRKERRRVSQMEALYMFYQPSDDVVRNGDIVQIKWGTSEKLAIVLTPACDLANPGKTNHLRLGSLNLQPNRNGSKAPDDRWLMTYNGQPYEVCFHEIIVLENTSSNREGDASVMIYNDTYQAIIGTVVFLKRVCRLDEPYRSDLLHQFVSHAGRVGRPDFTG